MRTASLIIPQLIRGTIVYEFIIQIVCTKLYDLLMNILSHKSKGQFYRFVLVNQRFASINEIVNFSVVLTPNVEE